ncbi:MAG: DUF5317 family protein, partial [Demequina sp.]
ALIWVALAVQVVIMQWDVAGAAAPVLHVLTYAAVLAFLWFNRNLPGALVVAIGTLSNGVTITLNGGDLPASSAAAEAAGHSQGDGFDNSAVVADPILPWLGDVFAWPAPLPLANTFSVGDVVLVIGVAVATWSGTRRFGAGRPAPSTDHQDTRQ